MDGISKFPFTQIHLGLKIIKNAAVSYDFCNKLECLFLASLSSRVYCLWARPGAYLRVENLKGVSLWQALAVPANTILSWQGSQGTNTRNEQLTAVKFFIGLARGGQSFHLFLKVVYLFNARINQTSMAVIFLHRYLMQAVLFFTKVSLSLTVTSNLV